MTNNMFSKVGLSAFAIAALCFSSVAFNKAHAAVDMQNSNAVIFMWNKIGMDGAYQLPFAAHRAQHDRLIYYPDVPNGSYSYFWEADPVIIAANVADELLALPEGSRFLFLRGFGEACPGYYYEYRGCDAVGGSVPEQIFENIGYTINDAYKDQTPELQSHHLTWLKTFLSSLNVDHGIKPDFLVLDYEMGYSYWHIRPKLGNSSAAVEEFFASIYDTYGDDLPENLLEFEPADFGDYWNSNEHPNGRNAVIAWNRFAGAKRNEVLGYYIREAVKHAYGEDASIPFSNYGNIAVSENHHDFNNWPIRPNIDENGDPLGLMGTHASPVLYYSIGNRHGRTNPQNGINFDLALEDKLRLIEDNVNTMKSPDLVVPWISLYAGEHGYTPDDVETFPYEHMIAGMNRSIIDVTSKLGVRHYLFFETSAVFDDDNDPKDNETIRENIQNLIYDLHANAGTRKPNGEDDVVDDVVDGGGNNPIQQPEAVDTNDSVQEVDSDVSTPQTPSSTPEPPPERKKPRFSGGGSSNKSKGSSTESSPASGADKSAKGDDAQSEGTEQCKTVHSNNSVVAFKPKSFGGCAPEPDKNPTE